MSEIRATRLEKIDKMREGGRHNPYDYTFPSTASASSISSAFEGKLGAGEDDPEGATYSVAGRIISRRVFGSLAFFLIQDESGQIQVQVSGSRLLLRSGGVECLAEAGKLRRRA